MGILLKYVAVKLKIILIVANFWAMCRHVWLSFRSRKDIAADMKYQHAYTIPKNESTFSTNSTESFCESINQKVTNNNI